MDKCLLKNAPLISENGRKTLMNVCMNVYVFKMERRRRAHRSISDHVDARAAISPRASAIVALQISFHIISYPNNAHL
ncbi:hypothetical protein MTP99_007977 [Tenebrio molitor]|nr:hypothetical protein MTP99_007977 [Tenebrio molitor]